MRIVLTGGGTLGPVAPLVAVWQALKNQADDIEVLFIGTATGPERPFLTQYPKIKFASIPAGKVRRYFSILNAFTPFLVLAGFVKSYFLLKSFKPDAVVSAGGFAAVPVIWASKILRAKIFIHQLDLQPSLSNILARKSADAITTTFEKSLEDFKEFKPVLIGSLIRDEAKNMAARPAAAGKSPFNILFLGGGTGAAALNILAINVALQLGHDFNVWQITGRAKKAKAESPANMKVFEFLTTDYFNLLNQADLVVSRAGLSTLMELSYFKKPVILVPLPNSHQIPNAEYFEAKNAAIYLKQSRLTPTILADKIKSLAQNHNQLTMISQNMGQAIKHGGEEVLAEIIARQ